MQDNVYEILKDAKSLALKVNYSTRIILQNISKEIPISDALAFFVLTGVTILSLHVYILMSAVDKSNFAATARRLESEKDILKEAISKTPAYSEAKPEAKIDKKQSGFVKKTVIYSTRNITRGSIDKKELSITFDGGAGDNSAKEILEILRKKGLKTTIFLTGEFIRKYPELIKEMAADGHEIGNHTFSHPHLTTYEKNFKQSTLAGVDREFIFNELKNTAELFKQITNKDMSPLWRAPYGEVNKEISQWAFEAGYIHISWTTDRKKRQSLDSLDWVADKDSTFYLTAEEIKQKIINFDRDGSGVNGGIVLLHLGSERQTEKAHEKLEEIIDTLSSQGYRFVKVSQMLNDSNLALLKKR